MPAKRYRFHCTDGRDAVFDRAGRLIGRQRALRSQAIAVALRLMEREAFDFDWSRWTVDVYDSDGRCMMWVSFSDARRGPNGRS